MSSCLSKQLCDIKSNCSSRTFFLSLYWNITRLCFPTEHLVLVSSIFHLTWPLHEFRPFVEKRHRVKLCLGKSPFPKYHFYLFLFFYRRKFVQIFPIRFPVMWDPSSRLVRNCPGIQIFAKYVLWRIFYCLAKLPTTMVVAGSVVHHLFQPIQGPIRRINMNHFESKLLFMLSLSHQLNPQSK